MLSNLVLDIPRSNVTLVVAHLTNKGETYVSIVSTTMLRMFFETNWWHVNNLTFVSLFITNFLNQEDLTFEMLLYALQACNTKLSTNFFRTRLFWNNLCHDQKNIDWWRCNTLLFGLLMFYNLSILSLCYCFVLTLEFFCVYF